MENTKLAPRKTFDTPLASRSVEVLVRNSSDDPDTEDDISGPALCMRKAAGRTQPSRLCPFQQGSSHIADVKTQSPGLMLWRSCLWRLSCAKSTWLPSLDYLPPDGTTAHSIPSLFHPHDRTTLCATCKSELTQVNASACRQIPVYVR